MIKKREWWTLSEVMTWAVSRDYSAVDEVDTDDDSASIAIHKRAVEDGSDWLLPFEAKNTQHGGIFRPSGKLFDLLRKQARDGNLRVEGRLADQAAHQPIHDREFDDLRFRYYPDGLQGKTAPEPRWLDVEFHRDDIQALLPHANAATPAPPSATPYPLSPPVNGASLPPDEIYRRVRSQGGDDIDAAAEVSYWHPLNRQQLAEAIPTSRTQSSQPKSKAERGRRLSRQIEERFPNFPRNYVPVL